MRLLSIFAACTFLFFCLVIFACNGAKNNEDGIQEVRLDERFSNADIVRNPVTAQGESDTSKIANIVFDKPVVDFGSVDEGTLVLHKFKFTNEGTNPLFIQDVRTTCGCTATEYPKEAILPGYKGEISVKFDTEGKEGAQPKTITVFSNSIPSETKLRLQGVVTKTGKLSDRVLEI